MTLELPPRPWIVGHRGAAGEAPENTVASVRLALDQGADMIELDLQLAADGVPVAGHDWTLERMGGVPFEVETTPSDELSGHDVSGPFAAAGGRTAPPTLAGILREFGDEVPFNLELKRRRADRSRFAATVAAAVEGRPNLLVSSFDWELLAALRALLPHLPIAPLGRDEPRALLAAAERLEAWSVHCRHDLASPNLIERAGRPVLAYTVNDPAAAVSLFELGLAGVFTDHPGRLRQKLPRIGDWRSGS